MLRFIVLVGLSVGIATGQLNFEGNPLTENTEYTAEESHYSSRHELGKSQKFDKTSDRSIDTYLAAANSLAGADNLTKNTEGHLIDVKSIRQPQTVNKVNQVSGTMTPEVSASRNSIKSSVTNQTQITSRQLQLSSADPLDSFLNSRTPQESQLALDNYLKSRQQPEQQYSLPHDSQIDTNLRETVNQNVQLDTTQYLSNQDNVNVLENVKNVNQAQLPSSSGVLPQQNGQIINSQVYQPHPLTPVWPQMGFQSRRDVLPAPEVPKRRPIYHYRSAPGRYRNRYRAQSRIGPNFISKPPLALPPGYHGSDKPVEVIYTRPPGFGHGPPPISNPPVPYEDASAYFPDADHPPINKDVYYSQLWAQSYDPHYYNYIAKTGKIKPWLYGKLGKHEDKGFWHELFLSFKKHGMKNMMNPMFLLGLSIPALTIMLTALVGKRSLGRSDNDSNYYLNQEKIAELAEKVQKAIECYEKNNANCWT